MKKCLSFVLSVVLLISCCISGLVLPVAATEPQTNPVTNNAQLTPLLNLDFEGELPGTGWDNLTDPDPEKGIATIDETGGIGGGKALKILSYAGADANADTFHRQWIKNIPFSKNLEAGKTYILRYSVKSDGTKNHLSINPQSGDDTTGLLKGVAMATATTTQYSADEWRTFQVLFTVGAEQYANAMSLQVGQYPVEAWYDNITIQEYTPGVNLAVGGDGSALPMVGNGSYFSPFHWSAAPITAGTLTVATDSDDSTNQVWKFAGNAAFNDNYDIRSHKQQILSGPNTDISNFISNGDVFKVSLRYKGVGTDAGKSVTLAAGTKSALIATHTITGNNGWKTVEAWFAAGKEDTSNSFSIAYPFKILIPATSSANGIYIDDFTIVETLQTAKSDGANYSDLANLTKVTAMQFGELPTSITVGNSLWLYPQGKVNGVWDPNAYCGTLDWNTSNPAVLSVDYNGKIKGVDAGTATITATADGISAGATFNVVYGSSFPRNGDFSEMDNFWNLNSAGNISIQEGAGENGSNAMVVWGSAGTSVSYTNEFVLLPSNTYKLSVRYKTIDTQSGATESGARVFFSGSTQIKLPYTHSEWQTAESIFTVRSTWTPTKGVDLSVILDNAIDEASPVIIDSINFSLYDSGIAATAVKITPNKLSLAPGQSSTLNVVVTPRNANANFMQWTSNNQNVAIVENGVVTAVGGGTATLTARTVNGIEGTIIVTVFGPEAYVKNSSFDIAADTTSWQLSNGAALVSGAGRGDSRALKLNSSTATATQTITGLNPGKTYQFMVATRSDDSAGGKFVLTPTGASEALATFTVSANSAWNSKTILFTTPENFSGADVTLSMARNGGSGSDALFVDNVIIAEGTSGADLVVSDILWNTNETQMQPGTPVNFCVKITNNGTEDIKDDKEIMVEIRANAEVISTVTFTGGLKQGTTAQVFSNTPWLATQGELVISAHVNTTFSVLETNTKNNGMQVNIRVAETALTAPSRASNAGFNYLAFSDDFTTNSIDEGLTGEYGYKWYLHSPFGGKDITTEDYEFITEGIRLKTYKDSGFTFSMSTLDAKTGSGWDYNFGYLEAKIRLNGVPTSTNPATPAIWALPRGTFVNGETCDRWVEMDWMEYWGTRYDSTGDWTWSITMHDKTADDASWYRNSNHAIESNFIFNNDFGDGNWHTLGWLWEEGSITAYLDGRRIFSQTYNAQGGANPTLETRKGQDDPTAMTLMNEQFLPIFMTGLEDVPMDIDYIRVWQSADTHTHTHVYTNDFDTACNLCGESRTITAQTVTKDGITYSIAPSENGGFVTVTDCDTTLSGKVAILSTVNECPVTSIGNSAFYNCQGITSVILPSCVTNIGNEAFSGCNSLADVWYTGSRAQKEQISIGTGNTALTNAAWHYDACPIGGEHTYNNACDATCDHCGELRTPPHAYEWVIDKENTCGENGQKHEECIGCHITRSEDTVIPATGEHNYEWVIDKENTCGENGQKHEECIGCHVTRGESVMIPATGEHVYSDICDDTCNNCDNSRIPPHNYEWVLDKENTCGEDGKKHEECTACHTTRSEDTVIPATGEHIYEWVVDKENACIEDGEKHEKCTVCHTTRNAGTVIPAIGNHTYTDSYDTTCNECGNTRTITAETVAIDGITYSIEPSENGGFVVVIGCDTTLSGDVTILSAVNGYAVTSIGANAFNDRRSITSVVIPNSVTSIGANAFENCRGLTLLVIPNSVTSIGEYAFKSCNALTSLTIPNSVTSVGTGAFSWSSKIASVTVGTGMTSIVEKMFHGCAGLTSVAIPNTVTSIGNSAFQACVSLASIAIPNSVTSIGANAFDTCENLTSVVLPSSVTSIGNRAFHPCPRLTDVWYIGSEAQKGQISIGTSNTPLNSATWHYNTCSNDEHTYAADCDTTCNHCEWERIASEQHTYSNAFDTDCDLCGAIRSLSGIELTIIPAKLTYLEVKDALDVTGGKVTLTYDNGTTADIDLAADMVSGFDNTIAGGQTLTVTYNGKTTTYDIEIIAKSMVSIEVTTKPSKLTYLKNDMLDLTGGKVTLYYNNDTSDVIDLTAAMVSGFDDTKVGSQTLTVTYQGMTDSYNIKMNQLSFAGASLSLHHNLAINYKVNKALFETVGYTNAYVVFELNGVTTTVTDYTISEDRCIFTFRNIAPNQMNDTIYATLYATYDGVEYESAVREYSVAEYCYNTLGKCTTDDYAKLRTLLVDLLHYGAQSQLYTEHNTQNLANANLTAAQLAWGTTEDPTLTNSLNTTYETVENPLVTWKGASLNLNDSVSMRFKFTAEDIKGLSLKVIGENGDEWTLKSSNFVLDDGVYSVRFNGLHAGQMSEKVYLTMYKDGVAVSNTVRYSIESYAYSKQNSSIEHLSDLVKAMMKYGNSAHSYVN